MSDKPGFVFVRGPVKVSVEGQELDAPAEAPPAAAPITRAGTFEFADGGDYLDFAMQVLPERMTA